MCGHVVFDDSGVSDTLFGYGTAPPRLTKSLLAKLVCLVKTSRQLLQRGNPVFISLEGNPARVGGTVINN